MEEEKNRHRLHRLTQINLCVLRCEKKQTQIAQIDIDLSLWLCGKKSFGL